MKKINSIHFGGKMIVSGLLLGILLPCIVWLLTGTFSWFYTIPGLLILAAFLILFAIEMKQDFGKIPYYEKHLRESFPFDPEHQIAVIRSSICNSEKIAGFLDKDTGHFTEVMILRNEEEKQRFMKIYALADIKTE